MYGRGYSGASAGAAGNGLNQHYTKATPFGTTCPADNCSNPTADGGAQFDYSDLVKNYINKNGYTLYGPNKYSDEFWLYNPKGGTFISFDNPTTIDDKTDYIKSAGLGGAMLWDVGYDTTAQSTSLTYRAYQDLIG